MPDGDQARIDDLFSSFGPVKLRRMFGAAGLYADDIMFGILDRGVIYLKADEALATEFAREGCARFTYQRKGRATATSYWRLPERLYDEPDELAVRARQALDCAKRRAVAAKGGRSALRVRD